MPCVGMQGHSKPKIMAARGRKGAATRGEAFMPQVQIEELLICIKAASVDTIGDMLSFFLHGLNSQSLIKLGVSANASDIWSLEPSCFMEITADLDMCKSQVVLCD